MLLQFTCRTWFALIRNLTSAIFNKSRCNSNVIKWHKKVGYIFLGSTEFNSNIIRHTQRKIITWDITGQKKTYNNYLQIFLGKTEDSTTCVFLVSLRPILHTSNSSSTGYLNRSVEHNKDRFSLALHVKWVLQNSEFVLSTSQKYVQLTSASSETE